MNTSSEEMNKVSDLAWLAERYVLGELLPHEADSFEERLATEQSAREAVAAAVAMFGGIQMEMASDAPRETVSLSQVQTKNWISRISWLSAIAATVLVLGFGVFQWKAGEAERTTALVIAWSETQDAIDQDHSEEPTVAADNSSPDLEDIDVPDWLVTAVSLGQDASTKREPAPLKPDVGEGA